MDNYIKGVKLGEGTFGAVIKATHKETGKEVAIKKVRIADAKQGIDVTALREIKMLQEMRHEYVIELLDVFAHKKNVIMVFEVMPNDLEAIIKDTTIVLSEADIKSYMRMALESLRFCHERHVVHRDIKPNNFLIADDGGLKLADFGLSRVFGSPEGHMTTQVFARWYRAPELIYGACQYTGAVDVWAIGLVMAELLLRRPWFPGTTDIDQLGKIFQGLGTPTDAQWPGRKELPNFLEFEATPAPPLASTFPSASPAALDMLSRLLAFDPARRPSAAEALKHKWFSSEPAPTEPAALPKPRNLAGDDVPSSAGARPNVDVDLAAEEENDAPSGIAAPDFTAIVEDTPGGEPTAKRLRLSMATDVSGGVPMSTGGTDAGAHLGAPPSLPMASAGTATPPERLVAGTAMLSTDGIPHSGVGNGGRPALSSADRDALRAPGGSLMGAFADAASDDDEL